MSWMTEGFSGWMDWPLDASWLCEVCGARDLTWGMLRGVCRCEKCHNLYKMRDAEGNRVTVPVNLTLEDYKVGIKRLWDSTGEPWEEYTDEEIKGAKG